MLGVFFNVNLMIIMVQKQALIIMGPQGSGKGTQSLLLSDHFGYPYVPTGDLLRAEIESETSLGLRIKDILARGDMVPDEVSWGIARNHISRFIESNGFICEGFPRSRVQADYLVDFLSDKSFVIRVILLEITIEIAIERMRARGRYDDTPDAMQKRLDLYHEKTKPVVEFFEKLPNCEVIRINGELSREGVFQEIIQKLSVDSK